MYLFFSFFLFQNFLLNITKFIIQGELIEDSRDFIANYLLHSAQNLSISSLNFTALYLISHGAIKLFLIIGLFRKKLSYYPISIAVFGLLVAYQLYRLSFTYSVWLWMITVIDMVVMGLIWHEYKYLRHIQLK